MTTLAVLAACICASPPTSIEVTAYNGGFGLVKEVRTLSLGAGVQTTAVEDVAQFIEPTSVSIKPIGGSGFSVLEQSYQYDLISTAAILQKAVGTFIKFRRVLPNGQTEVLEGTLMSAPTAIVGGSNTVYNGMVIKLADGRIILDPAGEIEVREIPNGLISQPSLVWTVDAPSAGNQNILLTYLTGGISWSADYVLTLDKSGSTAVLNSWVSMNNQSGATYTDAKLKLLAGEVHREQQGLSEDPTVITLGVRTRKFEAKQKVIQENFADYHLYTVTRPTTIKNNEIKQIALFDAPKVPISKKYILRFDSGGYPDNDMSKEESKPTVLVEFKNDKKSGLGVPFPAGKMKVFQADPSGSTQMLGEDAIDHTPKDETISLNVGQAFDIAGSRKRTSFQNIKIGGKTRGARESIEIEVRNRSEEPRTITVHESHYGDWKVTAKSQEWVKLSAMVMQFTVKLKPNEVKKITYTVETRW